MLNFENQLYKFRDLLEPIVAHGPPFPRLLIRDVVKALVIYC